MTTVLVSSFTCSVYLLVPFRVIIPHTFRCMLSRMQATRKPSPRVTKTVFFRTIQRLQHAGARALAAEQGVLV